MYTVYLDKQLIHDLDSEDNVLVNPTLELELNKAGTFTFSMECTHPYYDKLERFKSIVQVLCDGDEIFKGRIIEITDDMYKERTVYCESELAYLNDTIQRPHEYHLAASAVYEYLQAVIGSHNGQVDDTRQFTLGEITVTDPNDYIYCYTNYNSTMDEIKEDLVDDLGGYIRIRNDYINNDPLGELRTSSNSNGRYIDYIYLEEYGKTGEQRIEFGENLLDFSNDINQADICTGIIPLGATLEESQYAAIDERVTIESVNGGSDYLVISDAVDKYGLILKVVTWDDITEPKNLLAAAENYLKEYDYEPQTITATAVDMHLTDEQIESWRLGDNIFVESDPHDLHKRFPLAQMSIPLDQPENTSVTLGTYEDTSLSGRNNKTEAGLRNFENFEIGNVITSAVARATAIIDQHTNGYVTIHYDEERGCADEILIMDAPNTEDATRVWRWNLNGLGYSSTGYSGDDAAYGTAITMDGWILGNFIVANGMILADDNDDTFGKFTDQGMEIYQQAGNSDRLLMSIGQDGMKLYAGAYWGYGLMAEFNGSGMTVYGTAEQALLELNKGGMTINDNDGDMLANIGQSGIYLYDTNGIPSSSLTRSWVEIFDSDGRTLMYLNQSGLSLYTSSNVLKTQLNRNGIYYYEDDGDPLMQITTDGFVFYASQNRLGTIGHGTWYTNPSVHGLGIGIEHGAGYVSLGWKESSNASYYTTKISFHGSNSAEHQGVHFGDDVFLNNFLFYWSTDTSGGYVWAATGTGGASGESGASFYGSYWFGDGGVLRYNDFEVATKNDIAGLSLLANGEEAEGDFSLYSGLQLDISELVNYKSSDETLKTSIQPISDARVDNITPVTFKWRDGDNTAHYGYIAQEVREHIPEIVKENDDGLLSLAYTEIIPLLHAKINTLEATIDSMAQRIAKLEELIYGKEERD